MHLEKDTVIMIIRCPMCGEILDDKMEISTRQHYYNRYFTYVCPRCKHEWKSKVDNAFIKKGKVIC